MVKIDNASFGKIILHCYKYPTLQVFGILLGNKSGKEILIADSVPLFHGDILAPMLEISFKLIDNYAKAKDLSIIGCYYAEENNSANQLSQTIQTIGQKIQSMTGNAIILQVQNDQLIPNSFSNLPVYFVSNNWDKEIVNFEDGTSEFLESILNSEKWREFYDFDNHLQDIRRDWFNTSIFSELR